MLRANASTQPLRQHCYTFSMLLLWALLIAVLVGIVSLLRAMV